MNVRPNVIKGKVRGGLSLLVPESLKQSEVTRYRYPGPETSLRLHVSGLGDQMMARQFGRSFVEYLQTVGDPALGDVVLALGAAAPYQSIDPGDVNLYWWYSFRLYEDDPAAYLDTVIGERLDYEPDLMLCVSPALCDLAEDAGYDALYFPIGVDPEMYRPLGLEREGFGYAGGKNHKSPGDVETVMGPYVDSPDFEWVDDLSTPEQLNLWYNTRLVTFGLTEPSQREWGVVNSRVFETLATGTPFVLHEHPDVNDVLGFDYPYQVATTDEVHEVVDEFVADPDATLETFAGYADRVREDHSYVSRFDDLVRAVS